MSRAARLLDLMQVLRRHRRPVSGAVLAEELNVSLRTLYRDIATLQAQGADIAGEPGLGYVLKPGYMLPPLMFSADEIEALALGSQWVAERADPRLALAARDAMAKISAVLPRDIADALASSGLFTVASPRAPEVAVDLALVRYAIRAEHRLDIAYADATLRPTARSGHWRSPSSTIRASSSPGASYALISAASGPIASPNSLPPAHATPAAGNCC